jgi:hypothetical protein
VVERFAAYHSPSAPINYPNKEIAPKHNHRHDGQDEDETSKLRDQQLRVQLIARQRPTAEQAKPAWNSYHVWLGKDIRWAN